MQYEEPGKLSQYIYLNVLYQLVFDITIFGQSYVYMQWIGFSLLFSGYIAKFYNMLNSKRKGETAGKKMELDKQAIEEEKPTEVQIVVEDEEDNRKGILN